MKSKTIATIMLTLFLASMLSMAFNVTPVAAVYITDTMDADWDMLAEYGTVPVQGADVDYGYSTEEYISAPTSLVARIWGWGTAGNDWAWIEMSKTFSWEPHMPLVRLKLNYLIDIMTDTAPSRRYGCTYGG